MTAAEDEKLPVSEGVCQSTKKKIAFVRVLTTPTRPLFLHTTSSSFPYLKVMHPAVMRFHELVYFTVDGAGATGTRQRRLYPAPLERVEAALDDVVVESTALLDTCLVISIDACHQDAAVACLERGADVNCDTPELGGVFGRVGRPVTAESVAMWLLHGLEPSRFPATAVKSALRSDSAEASLVLLLEAGARIAGTGALEEAQAWMEDMQDLVRHADPEPEAQAAAREALAAAGRKLNLLRRYAKVELLLPLALGVGVDGARRGLIVRHVVGFVFGE